MLNIQTEHILTQAEIDDMYSHLELLNQDYKGNRLYKNQRGEKHWCKNLKDVIMFFGNIGNYQI